MSKLLVLLGSISILTPFSLDLYLPALPSIAVDLHAGAGSVQATLPVFFVGLAVSQLFFGSIADHLGRRPPPRVAGVDPPAVSRPQRRQLRSIGQMN